MSNRVRLSSEGKRLLVPSRHKMGPNTMATVTGYFAPLGITLNVDGYKAKNVRYHIDFWEQ